MKRTSIWALLMIVGILLWSTSVGASNNVLIGVVDVDLVMEQSDAGKLANADLSNLITNWQDKLDSLETVIVVLTEEIEGSEASLSAEKLEGKNQELESLLEQYQIAAAEGELEIQRRAEELYQLLLQDISLVIRLIGTREGYTIIAETSSLFYFGPQVDLTPEVIREYNKLLNESQVADESSE